MGRYEELALETIKFCQKWNIWKDISVFAEGKRFSDVAELSKKYKGLEGVEVAECKNPEEFTSQLTSRQNCDGTYAYEKKCFDNPEHLLEMTFEGPLYDVINYDSYTVPTEDWPEEARKFIADYFPKDVVSESLEYLRQESRTETREGYDPAKFDSYEEFLDLSRYMGPDYDSHTEKQKNINDITTREEYEEYLERIMVAKYSAIEEYIVEEDDDYEYQWELKDAADQVRGTIANVIFNELNGIFERYGVYFEICFRWSLSAFKI